MVTSHRQVLSTDFGGRARRLGLLQNRGQRESSHPIGNLAKGRSVAHGKGLQVTGTLGILDLAARRGLADYSQSVERLRQMNFRIPKTLLDALLEKRKRQKYPL